MKKTIKMICHGPISLGPEYRSPWEDVWIEYFWKRKKVNRGPCIVSKSSLDHDIAIAAEFGDYNFHALLQIRSNFKKGECFGVNDISSDVPEIYVNYEHIDRAIAEDAIAWYLREIGVTAELKFKWKKQKTIVVPFGV